MNKSCTVLSCFPLGKPPCKKCPFSICPRLLILPYPASEGTNKKKEKYPLKNVPVSDTDIDTETCICLASFPRRKVGSSAVGQQGAGTPGLHVELHVLCVVLPVPSLFFVQHQAVYGAGGARGRLHCSVLHSAGPSSVSRQTKGPLPLDGLQLAAGPP